MSQRLSAESAYDALACLVIRLDRDLCIRYINHFGLKCIGYEQADQLVGKSIAAILPADTESGQLMRALRTRPVAPYTVGIDSDLAGSDGARVPVYWQINNCPANDSAEQPAGTTEAQASVTLVGFESRAIRQCQATVAVLKTVTDDFSGSILITDPQQHILYANPAVSRMTGFGRDELVGQNVSLFKSGRTDVSIYQDMWRSLVAGKIWRGEFINRRKGGEEYPESKTISAIRDARGEVQYYLAIGEDVTQHRHYQQRIEDLLSSDQLTGLPNRSAFLRLLADALDQARQTKRKITLLHIDLDDFHVVNELLGTSEADRAITEVAGRIRCVLRQSDHLARLGNDEFAILIGPHDAEAASAIGATCERVLGAIRKRLGHTERPTHLSASIGVARYPGDGDNPSTLLGRALSATELAKSRGGDHFCLFDARHAGNIESQRALIGELSAAIRKSELVLHYQPQVSLLSGTIVGLEALVRWQHPQRGLIYPGDFIPPIEQHPCIVELGNWVLREACRQMRQWLNIGLPAVKVSINLAARHFLVDDLNAAIAAMLTEHSIAPRQLKEIGVGIALDDFGTGYSSLAYLSRLAIDVVKIDQSFVKDITTNPVNAAIAQATIAMSHKLGKIVLAEGVETEEQMQYLRRNECDEIQGYFFSKPRPADEIASLLHERRGFDLRRSNGADARGKVLFVDDDKHILSALRSCLRREGYEVLTASSAAEGFSLLAKNPVHVVVSDQRMPGMNGTEFLARVKTLYPETVRMVLSGQSEISAVTDSINIGAVYRFMLKPWDNDKLKDEIAGGLRHWRELYGRDGKDKAATNSSHTQEPSGAHSVRRVASGRSS